MIHLEKKSTCQTIRFQSNHSWLAGYLHLPGNVDAPPVIIGSHGLFSSANSPKQIALAQKCTEAGIGYFRFDHRGCGNSEGLFEEITSLENRRQDMIAAVECIRQRKDTGDRIGLFGSSFGGAVCLSVARLLDCYPLVVYAAPVRSRSIHPSHEDRSDELDATLPPELVFAKKHLRFDISARMAGVHTVLIFHGDADEIVPVDNAVEIYKKASHPKQLIIQTNGDHPMSDPGHQEEFMSETLYWFKKWLPDS